MTWIASGEVQTHLLLVIHFHHSVVMPCIHEVRDPKGDGMSALADIAGAWCELLLGVFLQP